MAKLFYKDKPIIGFDISNTGAKVMAIDIKKWSVIGYGSVDFDPKKVQEALDGTGEYVINGIKDLLYSKLVGSLPSNDSVIGIRTSKTYSRTFKIPISAAKNIMDAVKIEASQYIPVPTEALYLDYQVIEQTKDDITILMCAANQDFINKITSMVSAAGLEPVMIEPSINASARLLNIMESGQLTSIIVDIGPLLTDIAILDGGFVRISGSIPVGGNAFTIDIAKSLKVGLEEAHQLKVINGLSAGQRQQKIQQALDANLERIISEIKKVTRYYTERINSDKKIEQLLILGSSSNIPGLGDYFTNKLVIPARVASPWQQLDFAKLQQPSRQQRSNYITAAGLACIDPREIWL